MLTGHQTFVIRPTGDVRLNFPTFTPSFPDYASVSMVEVISANSEQINVKVTFSGVRSEQEAVSIAEVIAVQVADRLAYQYDLAVDDPVRGEATFAAPSDTGGLRVSSSHHMHLVTRAHLTQTISPQDTAHLTTFIESTDARKDSYYTHFRMIMRQRDPVAKFMHLYRMLLSLKGGPTFAQRLVDQYVLLQEPNVQQVFSSHANRNETIYTRLRNELGHEIPGTTPDSTRQGMEDNVNRLASLVKAAIASVP